MKKNIFKKFHFMAMLASLTLICWGGVTACSNGSDSDDDVTSVKLKGNFFESNDENAEWIYCTEELKETENGIWEGEITAVRGWDKFGLEINGTWYGAEEGITEIKDAKLVKDSTNGFWLATDKGGKSKVTVNLNTKTITVAEVKAESDPPVGDEEAEEFSFNHEASKISKTATSITVTVTNIIGTATDQCFWANTDGDKGDNLVSSKSEDGKDVYKLEITDATKIAYIKENGLAIKGAKGVTATVTVTTTEPEPPSTGDNETVKPGNDGDEEGSGDTPGDETTPTLPTWVGIKGGFESENGEWSYTTLSQTSDGIWEGTVKNITYQWPKFYIEAGVDETTIIYAGEGGSNGTNVTVNGESVALVETSNWDNLYTTSWENDSGTTSVNLKVTVDFTGNAPTIKIKSANEE